MQQTIPQASDYDSDYLGYASDYPSHQPPPQRTNDELNLLVLQRHNSQVASVLTTAPYAVIYSFATDPEPAWSKTGIEGSLFVCQMTPGPMTEDRFAAIVLNRRGLDNWEAPLVEGENASVEITDEYVIISFRGEYQQETYGIYIFSEGSGTSTEYTRQVIGEVLKSLATAAGVSRQAAERAASEVNARHTNGHVQEAESNLEIQDMGAPMGRQLSLQQLFGQQRSEDAGWSVRAHNLDTTPDQPPHPPTYAAAAQARPTSYAAAAASSSRPPQPQSQQSDVITNLFRNAGLGKQ